ncbi:Metallo-hydrolase/oxidoreductase [Neolentinus lepideus HHB14362 ss-1]|uniref:Metallo-hydrolase/oxidoreductase n=1 Tax=Neolentinus lepideus HHB14362 ss-1 TaxID=1314782 RepID=A0A165RMQ2_9AGAM|nr:Metallo-hydrolase/oxidoreductase [Neolentinus lepideus HHB14362 ss-1]
MEVLESLPPISRLSDRVVRVLGQNPGKFTLQGTNTYIVGTQNPYTLIDTGEGRDEVIPILESALKEVSSPSNPDQPDVSDIIITHRHHDHIGGLPSVLALLRRLWEIRNPQAKLSFKPPRIHKFPLPATAQDAQVQAVLDSMLLGSFTPSSTGAPLHDLTVGQVLEIQSSPSVALHVLHTPGHTLDSICLHLPEDNALFTADTVLGQGTAVFEDLSTYISSLQSMLVFRDREPGKTDYAVLYPGHGPIVAEGPKTISTYIQHRLERESQILQVLRSSEITWTPWTIVSKIYAAYPENLWLPASHGVILHLRKLEKDGKVSFLGGEGKDGQWQLV